MRELTFNQAILEATAIALQNKDTILIGEGVPDPKAIFGTTKGLKEKYPNQVFDSPVSEAGVTGICIGASLNGMRVIQTHQRIDFSLYAMDQIVNNAAKWMSMFSGNNGSVNLTVRMIIGRGWGQGNQHSQNLAHIYASIPGLKVVMPSNPVDAKGLFLKAIADPNPVIFLEHKWLQQLKDYVPPVHYETDFQPQSYGKGKDLTIVSWGYAFRECMLAAKYLENYGISTTLIDLRCLNPINHEPILASLATTGALLVVDDAWYQASLGAHIIAHAVENMTLDKKPIRINYPNYPSPSTHALTDRYYSTALDIVRTISSKWARNIPLDDLEAHIAKRPPHDVDPYSRTITSAI